MLWITIAYAQEHCVFSPIHIATELFPGAIGELNSLDYFVFYTDSIEFDGLKYKIDESSTTPFDNKDDLLRIFSCNYDFLNASENITGALIRYNLESKIQSVGKNIIFIYFNDCGNERYYVYVADGLYLFSNNPTFVDREVTKLIQTEEEEIVVNFTHNADTNGYVYYIEEPVYEIVTEQFLVKEAYNVLKELPNEFEESFIYLNNEFSDCKNAVFDTIYEQVLVKEGGLNFEISPAIFGTYQELRIIQNEYEGQGFYERELQDSMVITLRSSYIDIIGADVNSGCTEFDFYDCVNLNLENIPSKDTTVYNVYEKCADGFESAGKYCYSNSGVVPRVFDSRLYEKLVAPANGTSIIQLNEYKTVASIRVINKDELEDDCVVTVVDSIPYQKLVKPATLEHTSVPAVYETLQRKLFQNGGIIEVESGGADSHYQISSTIASTFELKDVDGSVLLEDRTCYLEAIKLKLIEVEYLSEDDIDDLVAFQLATLNFQIDNDLPLGVIDTYLINTLEVNFGF